MIRAVASLFFLVLLPHSAEAAFTDFEDLPGGAVYSVGSTINSKSLSFEVVPFPGDTGNVSSGILGDGGPDPTTVLSGGGLEFVLPVNTNYIRFDYFASPNGSGVVINGISSPLSSVGDLPADTIIGGVSVHFEPHSSRPFRRLLILSGDIDTFVVGGIEFSIDNVAVFVPEPSALALVSLAAATMACRRL